MTGSMKEVGRTSRGYTLFAEETEVGSTAYWSDEIGGGVLVWDTALACPETLRLALELEEQKHEAKSQGQS